MYKLELWENDVLTIRFIGADAQRAEIIKKVVEELKVFDTVVLVWTSQDEYGQKEADYPF